MYPFIINSLIYNIFFCFSRHLENYCEFLIPPKVITKFTFLLEKILKYKIEKFYVNVSPGTTTSIERPFSWLIARLVFGSG